MRHNPGHSLIEIVIGFALLGYGSIFFFSALSSQAKGGQQARYRVEAESLAKAGLHKAQALKVGEAGDEVTKSLGYDFQLHYEAQALPDVEANSARKLVARVKVLKNPRPEPVYQTVRVLFTSDLAL